MKWPELTRTHQDVNPQGTRNPGELLVCSHCLLVGSWWTSGGFWLVLVGSGLFTFYKMRYICYITLIQNKNRKKILEICKDFFWTIPVSQTQNDFEWTSTCALLLNQQRFRFIIYIEVNYMLYIRRTVTIANFINVMSYFGQMLMVKFSLNDTVFILYVSAKVKFYSLIK